LLPHESPENRGASIENRVSDVEISIIGWEEPIRMQPRAWILYLDVQAKLAIILS